ncbi:MAG: NADH-quinone oxidoreductase subunit L, partial [Caldimonas sp.]
MLTSIVLLPLLGFLLNGILATRLGGNRVGKRFVSAVGCGLPILAFAITVKALLDLQAGAYSPLVEIAYRWAQIGDGRFEISFYFDRLTAVMALIVTGVGSVIHVYSIGYMKDDESYGRFFAYLNLFLFFMLLLVLGRSLLVLFVGWEGVGLASYLLIGFWFDDLANARAGKKAFITNRIGDAGFLLGMFVLYQAFGTLDMDRINAAFGGAAVPAVSASLVGILLFIGATGKSAQIPLHVWLPDAMAGPTPVSALIHAATMVTAGVYLVARMSGVYLHAPEASTVIAVIGVATAFFAATIALVQTDIKKVLAYSTISQLGFMFLALGVGAYGVAIFHVVTHAFFKACLFLGAGSVIHALSGEQDVRKMGGLARRIPLTFVTFAVATAAIAGIPPLAGFFSKDEILWYAFASTRGGSPLLWGVAAATALMTAFYMFRLLWLTFLGKSRMSAEVEHHVHESPLSMTGVLMILAVASALGGFVPLPHFLEPLLPLA